MDCNYVQEAAEYVRARIGETPRIGLILGSGLGGIAEVIEDKHVIPYGEIPHFVCSTAPGHKGQFVAGRFGGKPSSACRAVSTSMRATHCPTSFSPCG